MYKRVLLPLDGSPVAEQALPRAIAQARCLQAGLILLRVVEPFTFVRRLSPADLGQTWQSAKTRARQSLERIAADLQQQSIL